MDCYTYTKDGMVATISGPWVLYEDVEPLQTENQRLYEEDVVMAAELFRIVDAFEKYREKVHESNNAVQVKLSKLEVENERLKDAVRHLLDFDFGSIGEAKALLESSI